MTHTLPGTTWRRGRCWCSRSLFLGLIIVCRRSRCAARASTSRRAGSTRSRPAREASSSSLDEPVNLYFFFSEEASRLGPRRRAPTRSACASCSRSWPQRSNGKLRLTVDRPAAVLRGRGPRDGLRARRACRSAPTAQHAVLRPRRHELDRRPRGHRLLPAATRRSSSSTTSRAWSTELAQPEETGRRLLSTLPVDAVVRPDDGADARGLGGHPADTRSSSTCATVAIDATSHRRGRRRADARASEGSAASDALRDRPVRDARRASCSPSSIQSPSRIDPPTRWAAWARWAPIGARTWRPCSRPGASPTTRNR